MVERMATLEIYNGDCLQIMKDLSANTIDCFICDLPYGCLVGCSWDNKIDLEEFWTQVKRLRRNKHVPVLMFCSTRFGYELIQSNPSWFRYDLVWDKQRGVSFLSANKMPMRSHEMIYVFSELGAYYNRVDVKGDFAEGGGGRSRSKFIDSINGLQENKPSEAGRRCVKTVIPISTHLKKDQHPTEKPMTLYSFLLLRYCPPGGTVLDPTAGSFNSCFTAFDMNLNAVGIEKDETFFKKASDKLDAIKT